MGASVHRSNTLNIVLAQARRRIGARLARGLEAAGEVLKEESLKLVPRDTDILADSARSIRYGSNTESQVVVSYGRKDIPPETRYSEREGKMVTRQAADYAVYTHMGAVGLATGQPDYLEEPRLTKQEEIRAALNAALRT